MTDSALPRRRFLGRALAAMAAGTWLGRAVRPAPVEAAPQQDAPYIAEIRMFAGNFAPLGWAFCNGQLLAISQNDALFSLIGTTYGGDGFTTFALPDLRGRAPVHMGQGPGLQNFVLGQQGGAEVVTLNVAQLPIHSHVAGASSANGSSDGPAGGVPARNAAGAPQYGTPPNTNMAAAALQSTGGTQPHTNMQPCLAINFIICLEGIYPSQN
jgi:microcystin-dependent protein